MILKFTLKSFYSNLTFASSNLITSYIKLHTFYDQNNVKLEMNTTEIVWHWLFMFQWMYLMVEYDKFIAPSIQLSTRRSSSFFGLIILTKWPTCVSHLNNYNTFKMDSFSVNKKSWITFRIGSLHLLICFLIDVLKSVWVSLPTPLVTVFLKKNKQKKIKLYENRFCD